MNEDAQSTCPFCAEPIKSAARLCPHCRQWLTIRSLRNPVVAFWVSGLPMLVLFVVLGVSGLRALYRVTDPLPHFDPSLHSIEIIDSRMTWTQPRDTLWIYVVGTLTNKSSIAWKGIEFECRFYDSNGVMIDTAHPVGSFTVEPMEEAAFRLSMSPTAATNRYASHKLKIVTARNTQAFF